MIRIGFLVSLFFLSACTDLVTDIFEYGSVEVRAVRRNGEPVPGAELTLYSSFQVMAQGVTDETGQHLFEFVPPNQYGVHAEPPDGYLRPDNVMGGPSTAYIDGILMEEGTDAGVSFIYLKVGPGRIEVSVREPDGAPVEDATVHLYASDRELGTATVGSTGMVAFEAVPFGNRGVWIMPPVIFLDVGEEPPFRQGILVEEGSDQRVDFVLERCLGTIRGSVQDPAGAPVTGVPLRLYRPFEDVAIQETGSEGEAVFDSLRCWEFGVALMPAPGWSFEEGRGKSFHDGIQVHRGSDRTLSFTVRRCASEIRVNVVDPQGSPVQDVALDLYTALRSWAEGLTGADGWYSFSDVHCGHEFGVGLRPGVGYLIEEGRGTSFVDGLWIRDGEVQTHSFTVLRCSPTIQIRVEDEAGGPVPNAGLELYSTQGSLATGVSGADGFYNFSAFTCGLEYGVKIQPSEGYTVVEGRGSSFFDGIRLDPEETLQLTFRLQTAHP